MAWVRGLRGWRGFVGAWVKNLAWVKFLAWVRGSRGSKNFWRGLQNFWRGLKFWCGLKFWRGYGYKVFCGGW